MIPALERVAPAGDAVRPRREQLSVAPRTYLVGIETVEDPAVPERVVAQRRAGGDHHGVMIPVRQR